MLVTADELAAALNLPDDYDIDGLEQVTESASTVVMSLLRKKDKDGVAINHDTHAQDREAALHVAVEMYQARTSAGGQAVGADFTPGPYRLSVWVTRRVAALTAPCYNVRSMVG